MTTVSAARRADAMAEMNVVDELSYSIRQCARCGGRLHAVRGLLLARWVCSICGKRAH